MLPWRLLRRVLAEWGWGPDLPDERFARKKGVEMNTTQHPKIIDSTDRVLAPASWPSWRESSVDVALALAAAS
jgi:hypothetical protein